jgi:hypothetical protein
MLEKWSGEGLAFVEALLKPLPRDRMAVSEMAMSEMAVSEDVVAPPMPGVLLCSETVCSSLGTRSTS